MTVHFTCNAVTFIAGKVAQDVYMTVICSLGMTLHLTLHLTLHFELQPTL